MTTTQARRGRRDAGQVTAFIVVFTLALVLLGGLVLDGGLALSAELRALNQAQAAARAGAQQVDVSAYRQRGVTRLVPTRARAAALDYLAALDGARGTVTVAGDTVTVTVRRTQPTQILRIAGIAAFHVEATASADATRGITRPLEAPEASP